MKKALTVIVAAMALTLGGLTAAAVAQGPPSGNPGSPGDDCSHGNSNQPCRPDPSPNGKDCEDHGKASGNEDHCDGTTTTPTETTPTETTPTETTPTDTTPTTPEETTTSTTTTPEAPVVTEPGTTTTSETPGPVPSSVPSAPTPSSSKPTLEKQLQKQAKANGAVNAPASTPAARSTDELPYTGFPLKGIAALGAALVAAGLGLRRKPS